MVRRVVGIATLGVVLGCPLPEQPVAGGTGGRSSSGDGGDGGSATGCSGGCDSSGGVADDGAPMCTVGADGKIDCSLPECVDHQACIDPTFRIMTWNILRVGAPGSDQFEAEAAIVRRIDPDVLCLQEVGEGEESNLQALADVGGYDYGLLAPFSGPPGNGIAPACMSRIPSFETAYVWSDWISPDGNARDMTRPFVRIRLHHAPTDRDISVITAHLKAGTQDVDRFRRMVDTIRLGQLAGTELAQHPDNVVVALGDFNESPNPSTQTWDALPAGLPDFYALGSDISLPLTYAPESRMTAAGLHPIEAHWEDDTQDATFITYERRIDYIWINDKEVLASEVYEACNDDGIDQAPKGDVLPKVGDPLDCGTNDAASDHRPVIADIKIR